jgi:hypothetical protein
MNRQLVLLPIALIALALGFAPRALSLTTRPSGTLQLNFASTQNWRIAREYCPPGTPAAADCLRSVGTTEVAGLGRVTVSYVKILPGDDPNCFMVHHNTAVIEVAGKGMLELWRPGRSCASGPPPREDGPFEFTVASGSGVYAEASGTLVSRTVIPPGNPVCRCGTARETWTGMLTAPGVDFDVTPPVLTGAVSKTIRARKRAKRIRVRYTVTARDEVDGPVPVLCTPRSGSYFKLGRTRVACSAKDSSSNLRRTRFSITVRPRK